MEKIINAWGNGGLAGVAALFMCACMNMFPPGQDDRFIVRAFTQKDEKKLVDFANDTLESYRTYYEKIYGIKPQTISFQTIELRSDEIRSNIAEQFPDDTELLSLGCTRTEMEGGFSDSSSEWRIQEILTSAADLSKLHAGLDREISGTQAVLINCGDYRDVLATVWIPLENQCTIERQYIQRYNVITGFPDHRMIERIKTEQPFAAARLINLTRKRELPVRTAPLLTDMLNALVMREVLSDRSDQYKNGEVYMFGSADTPSLLKHDLFNSATKQAFLSFLITAVILKEKVCMYFREFDNKRSLNVTQKWASASGIFKNNYRTPENAAFAESVMTELVKVIDDYYMKIIDDLKHMDHAPIIPSDFSKYLSPEYATNGDGRVYYANEVIKWILETMFELNLEKKMENVSRKLDEVAERFPERKVDSAEQYAECVIRFAVEIAQELARQVLEG